VAAAVVGLPVLACTYPPMIDLPCHEEIVAAMRHFGDASRYPPGLMTWNLGHPNQLFYFVAYALALVMPVSLACKAVVAGSVAGIPVAAGRLADHLGTSRWAALSVAPLGLGFLFYFGFVGNLLAFGLLMAWLPAFDRLARAPSAARAAGVLGALLILYTAHETALVIGCLAVVVLSAGRPLVRRASVWRLAPLVIVSGLAVCELLVAMKQQGPNLTALPRVIDLAAWQKRDGIPQALLGLHGATTTARPFVPLAVVVAVCILERALAMRRTRSSSWAGFIDAHRFEVFAAVLLVAYFEVPFAYAGAMWLHARFLGPGVAVLMVALAPRGPSLLCRGARAVSLLAVALTVLMVEKEMLATGSLYRELDPIVARVARGSAIASIDLSGGQRMGLVFTVGGASSRAASERGGRMATSFTQTSPIPPVIVAPEHRWDDALSRLSRSTLLLEPKFDLRRFRYVISWAPDARDQVAVVRALAPEAHLVARSGWWLLFESTLPVESVLSPEPPSSGEATVRERMENR
jgi:hypothetical protein